MAKALAKLGGLENISDSPETSKAFVISIDHSSMSLYSDADSHFYRNSRMNSSTCSYSNTEIISNRNYNKTSTEPSLMATENSTFDGNIIEYGTYDFNRVNKDNAKVKDVENQDYQNKRMMCILTQRATIKHDEAPVVSYRVNQFVNECIAIAYYLSAREAAIGYFAYDVASSTRRMFVKGFLPLVALTLRMCL